MKQKCVMTATIIFFFVSLPAVYKLVDDLLNWLGFNLKSVDENGTPTNTGLIVHTIIFALVYNSLCPMK